MGALPVSGGFIHHPLAQMRNALAENLPENREDWSPDQALFRFAQSLVDGTRQYRAVEQVLKKAYPIFRHIPSKEKIIDTCKDLIQESIHAVTHLDHSCLSIQGPPGAGKTFTAAHIILALMSHGKKIGVSSNSHKAINNLLTGIEKYAHKQGITFTGIKKCSHASKDSHLNGSIIVGVTSNEDAMDDAVDLVGGTAWFFADPGNDQRFDYLFVDEAGQVSLANIIAMGVSAKNIVLLGDQMQLGQPIQGRHRGQIPGTGSRDCHCFHDHLQPGIPAPAHGFSVQQKTVQRGPVPGQKPGHTHCKPPAAGNRLQYC
jgi:superfamily I DNA and/or RNA helicase